MKVVSHRGINIGRCPFYESTFEAFAFELDLGFGIEFDVSFDKNYQAIVFHDSTIGRLTNWEDNRKVSEITLHQLNNFLEPKNKVCTLKDLLTKLEEYPNVTNTLHLKGRYQDESHLLSFINEIKKYKNNNILIFDLIPSAAKVIKNHIPDLKLAPSVSHKYDVFRFNEFTYGTLMTIDEMIDHSSEYSWVWLDEWDCKDDHGGRKTLYNKTTINRIRKYGLKIGLVTPELHSMSPSKTSNPHEDSISPKKLFERIEKIIELNPDIICTDYPSEVFNKIRTC